MNKSKLRLTSGVVEKRSPKKNAISGKPRKKTAPQPQKQTADNYNSEQPLKQEFGETDKEFLERQRTQGQNAEKPQKDGFIQRGKNYASEQANKAKDYGVQKGKEAIGKGTDYAKGKGKEFLDKNPKAAGAINRAQEAKQNFEDRMNQFRDSAELSAGKPPIKQNPGESDLEFRKRQQKEDDNAPENPQRMGLRDAAKQHAKNYGKKQLGKGAGYAKRKIAASPALTSTSNKIKAAKEMADAIKKRSEEIKKQAALKTEGINKRIKALKNIYNAKKLIKKKIEDEAKKLALKIAQAAARFILQIIMAVIGAFSEVIAIIFAVVLLLVIIMVAIGYACNSNFIAESFCSAVFGT